MATLTENHHIKQEVLGPLSCPSIETKIRRFPHLSHRVFIEPEGFNATTVYPAGFAITSRPDAQLACLRTIPGLERVEMSVAGYGVHYDAVDARQLTRSLEVRSICGLFLAGQINGTTGYEEAAAQGVVAGISAACQAAGRPQLKIDRSQGYIGVLVDDLTSLGINEPYRMYTSRAEFRLHLRPDNADMRLTELGRRHGAVGDCRYERFSAVRDRLAECCRRLKSAEMTIGRWNRLLPVLQAAEKPKPLSAYDVLSRHHEKVTLADLAAALPELRLDEFATDRNLEDRLKSEGRYANQTHQHVNMNELRQEQNVELPEDADYNRSSVQKVPGITPDALLFLLRHTKQGSIPRLQS